MRDSHEPTKDYVSIFLAGCPFVTSFLDGTVCLFQSDGVQKAWPTFFPSGLDICEDNESGPNGHAIGTYLHFFGLQRVSSTQKVKVDYHVYSLKDTMP